MHGVESLSVLLLPLNTKYRLNHVQDCSDERQTPRTNSSTFPAWALAARIVFAISPNSASCERVFALLKNLFGEQQMLALADYVQASLMLNYNGRRVG